MRIANTQLASWAQLRHDSILYVKQSYTRQSECLYPTGYVDPYPAFWGRMELMLTKSAPLLEQLENPKLGRGQANFLRKFAGHVSTLKSISEKQLAQKELSGQETEFLKKVVSALRKMMGRVAVRATMAGILISSSPDEMMPMSPILSSPTSTPMSPILTWATPAASCTRESAKSI